MKTAAVCLLLILPTTTAAVASEKPDKPDKPNYEPTSNYTQQKIEGWTVFVNHRLLEDQKALGDRALKLLRVKLHDVNRAVPPKALSKLHEVPIWLEFHHPRHPCACYHPNKQWLIDNHFNPQKARAVEISNAANFLTWTKQQPSMVLHELAHGYHDRLPGGYGNRDVAAAYRQAMQRKTYDSVLHYSGKTKRAYAANNPQEYFAEATEAWFGTNDFYPFVRAELIKHDPELAELLKKLWKEGEEK